MNLLETLPPRPFSVGNYKKLAAMLGDEAYTGSSRVCHLKYIKQFLDFERIVVDGKKTHMIRVAAITKPVYIKWVPAKWQWPHDTSLLVGHYLTISIQGNGPNPVSRDVQTLVVTTADLCSLLGLGNRKVGQWRRGELRDIDLDPEDQRQQYKCYYKFISTVLSSLVTSQIFLQQFVMERWWVLLKNLAASESWHMASVEEQVEIERISYALQKEIGAKNLAHVFLMHKEEWFYTELNARILGAKDAEGKLVFPDVQQAWRVWWFRPGKHESEVLNNADFEELQINIADATVRWATGSGIDPEIIDRAIAKRLT